MATLGRAAEVLLLRECDDVAQFSEGHRQSTGDTMSRSSSTVPLSGFLRGRRTVSMGRTRAIGLPPRVTTSVMRVRRTSSNNAGQRPLNSVAEMIFVIVTSY